MSSPQIHGQQIDPLREWTGGSGHSYTGPCDMLDLHLTPCRGSGNVADGERASSPAQPGPSCRPVSARLTQMAPSPARHLRQAHESRSCQQVARHGVVAGAQERIAHCCHASAAGRMSWVTCGRYCMPAGT